MVGKTRGRGWGVGPLEGGSGVWWTTKGRERGREPIEGAPPPSVGYKYLFDLIEVSEGERE